MFDLIIAQMNKIAQIQHEASKNNYSHDKKSSLNFKRGKEVHRTNILLTQKRIQRFHVTSKNVNTEENPRGLHMTSLQHTVLLDLVIALVVNVGHVWVLTLNVWNEVVLSHVLSFVKKNVGAVRVDTTLVHLLKK